MTKNQFVKDYEMQRIVLDDSFKNLWRQIVDMKPTALSHPSETLNAILKNRIEDLQAQINGIKKIIE